jgi:hypothetical protein
MGVAGHEFPGTLADPFRSLTPQETMVVEEELEQGRQILVQLSGEGQQIVSLVGQGTDHRANAMGAEQFA